MQVLIVENSVPLGTIWKRSLEKLGVSVALAHEYGDAIGFLQENDVRVILLNLVLKEGSAFAIADFASYRQPDAKVVFVTNTTFFSDGSIFEFIPNACAFLQTATPPDDLAVMVDHYAGIS
jgi:ActR/RegA family two-component response regulator